jgi:hypothetical protein
MATTNAFFSWFFYGLVGGMGGWLIFLVLALAAVIWMLYDSGTRRLPALGWKMAEILTAALILPTILFWFTTDRVDVLLSPLYPYAEPIFYLGILGGLLPLVLAIGYFVTFQGMNGCPRGMHGVYETVLGQCPECARMDMPPAPVVIQSSAAYPPQRGAGGNGGESVAPLPPSKRKVQAWLISTNGKSYQLCEHETTVGRMASNDIYLTNDATVSRQHAKIIEQGGRFKLFDLGSKGLTHVNGRTVREPVLLETDDEIKFGDNTVLQFKK